MSKKLVYMAPAIVGTSLFAADKPEPWTWTAFAASVVGGAVAATFGTPAVTVGTNFGW